MGAVLSAVSPAVVIPRTVQLIGGNGTDKSILDDHGRASCDDILSLSFSPLLSPWV